MTESYAGQAITVPDDAPASQGRDKQDACWREAAQLRSQFRAWIVVWLAPENCYRAYRRLSYWNDPAATPAQIAATIAAVLAAIATQE